MESRRPAGHCRASLTSVSLAPASPDGRAASTASAIENTPSISSPMSLLNTVTRWVLGGAVGPQGRPSSACTRAGRRGSGHRHRPDPRPGRRLPRSRWSARGDHRPVPESGTARRSVQTSTSSSVFIDSPRNKNAKAPTTNTTVTRRMWRLIHSKKPDPVFADVLVTRSPNVGYTQSYRVPNAVALSARKIGS